MSDTLNTSTIVLKDLGSGRAIMKHIAMLLIAVASVSAQIYIYPPVTDTTIAAFDPLHVSQKWGSSVTFSLHWASHLVHRDSVTWRIDGSAVSGEDGTAYPGSADRTQVPDTNYSDGSVWDLSEEAASTKYAAGVHTISVEARYVDSTVTVQWQFVYEPTVYKEVRALLVLDTLWQYRSEYNGGLVTHTAYRIVAASPMDTSVFANARVGSDTLIAYDTEGMERTYSEESAQFPIANAKDTVDCFVLQILSGNPLRAQWLISRPVSSWLTQSNPPFPLTSAIAAVNAYLRANNVYRGYSPPSGDLKLGPVLTVNRMGADAGWRLNARHDDSCWILTHLAGSGDCPCGCIDWSTTVYTVSSSGAVTASQQLHDRGVPRVRVSASCPMQRHSQTLYRIDGRMLRTIPGARSIQRQGIAVARTGDGRSRLVVQGL
jgi:hypothetical protein